MTRFPTSDPQERQAELAALAPDLARYTARHPWHVPSDYFATLPESVWQHINGTPTDIPAGYFTQLPDQVMARIRAAEEAEPTLSFATHPQPFQVPDNYFDTLPEQVTRQVVAQQTRVIKLQRRWYTAVTAAAVLAAIIIGYLSWQPEKQPAVLAWETVSSTELAAYVSDHVEEWDAEELMDLTDQETTLLMDSTQTEQIEDWVLEEMDVQELEDLL